MAEKENAADHNAKRQAAMYKDEPKKSGKGQVSGNADAGDGGDAQHPPKADMFERHKREREETHGRHAKERADMHKRHETDFDQMNARQDDEIAAAPQDAGPVQDAASTAGADQTMGQGAAAGV